MGPGKRSDAVRLLRELRRGGGGAGGQAPDLRGAGNRATEDDFLSQAGRSRSRVTGGSVTWSLGQRACREHLLLSFRPVPGAALPR